MFKDIFHTLTLDVFKDDIPTRTTQVNNMLRKKIRDALYAIKLMSDTVYNRQKLLKRCLAALKKVNSDDQELINEIREELDSIDEEYLKTYRVEIIKMMKED